MTMTIQTGDWPVATPPAFSNSTEWEIWSAAWCWTCAHDDGPDADPIAGDQCCPIIGDLHGHITNKAIRRDPNGLQTVCLEYLPSTPAKIDKC